ncbi:MAG: hypothetical protein AAF699_02475 [Pseudomonadota bacterium]
MNHDKLRQAEASFLQRYPGGFADPELEPIKKKHNIEKLTEFTQASLAPENFSRPERIVEALVKIVSRSSMVSRFEKPRFREFVGALNSAERQVLSDAVEKRLYGRRKRQGFDEMLGMLAHHRLAKWAVISVVPFYFAPTQEAFVKPTTAKGIIQYLEVADLEYKPMPSWQFYRGYVRLLDEVRASAVPTLSPNYAALTGFLMMSL